MPSVCTRDPNPNSSRALRRRRALRLIKSARKSQASPYSCRSHGDGPASARASSSLVTPPTRRFIPDCCQCCQVCWRLSLVESYRGAQGTARRLVRVISDSPSLCLSGSPDLACGAVDATSVTTLVALRDSFRCKNRGPPVKVLSNRSGNVVRSASAGLAAVCRCWSHAHSARSTTAEIGSWQAYRLGRWKKAIIQNVLYSGLGRAPHTEP